MRKNKNFKFRYLKYGFTLAEVLITLVIIGIVAAMTIPSLIVKLDKVVTENQIKVFESKLQKGMDRMNLAGEIGPYYQTTEDFIKALSAHMKIVTICKAGELENCFPYESIQVQGLDEPVKVKEIDSGKSFGLNDAGYKDVAGMVLADGTPMILSWNTDCPVSDPDSSTRKGSIAGDGEAISTTTCIKGIYDINGTKGPNLFTKDVLSYGGVALEKSGAFSGNLAWLNGARIVKVGSYQPMTLSEICGSSATANTECTASTQEAIELGITKGYYATDYWAGAVRECGGVSKIPTLAQLAKLAEALYISRSDGSSPTIGERAAYIEGNYNSNSDAAKFLAANGLSATGDNDSNRFYLWSQNEISGRYTYNRLFSYGYTYADDLSRAPAYRYKMSENRSVICLP